MSGSSSALPETLKPLPTDFVEFLPWACFQFQLDFTPIVTAIPLAELDTSKDTKKTKSHIESGPQTVSDEDTYPDTMNIENPVFIDAIFATDNLVQLKFSDNIVVPREIFKVIFLIIQFYKELTAIYIDSGLKQDAMYELSKLIVVSQITEVILDNNANKKVTYYSLLENTRLKYLSLARCSIDDDGVKELALRLKYPLSASKSLTAFSLSSNAITDEGAIHLANMLRTNRQLVYLNLAGNMITDTGAKCILNTLIQFPLTTEEKNDLSVRKNIHMKEKKKFLQEAAARYAATAGILHQSAAPRKMSMVAKKGNVAEQQNKSARSQAAEESAHVEFGDFKDPFSSDNLVTINDVLHCCGNNILCYINLAYNNLGYFTVNKLLTVLTTQLTQNRKPKGLINVCIEGNMIADCSELTTINSIIQATFEQIAQTPLKEKSKKPKLSMKSQSGH